MRVFGGICPHLAVGTSTDTYLCQRAFTLYFNKYFTIFLETIHLTEINYYLKCPQTFYSYFDLDWLIHIKCYGVLTMEGKTSDRNASIASLCNLVKMENNDIKKKKC